MLKNWLVTLGVHKELGRVLTQSPKILGSVLCSDSLFYKTISEGSTVIMR